MGLHFFPFSTIDVAIAINTSLSAAVQIGPGRIVGIQMPSAWTTGDLTFQASQDGTTYSDVYDDAGNELVVKAAASRYILLTAVLAAGGFEHAAFIKVRSGTTGSAVNQLAARTVTLIARKQDSVT